MGKIVESMSLDSGGFLCTEICVFNSLSWIKMLFDVLTNQSEQVIL